MVGSLHPIVLNGMVTVTHPAVRKKIRKEREVHALRPRKPYTDNEGTPNLQSLAAAAAAAAVAVASIATAVDTSAIHHAHVGPSKTTCCTLESLA